MSSMEFVPGGNSGQDCGDGETWGNPSIRYTWIFKGNADPDSYPDDACQPWYHFNAKIGNLQATQTVVAATQVTAAGITLTTRKPFDIPHPTKKGWRLRHVCLEGPESGVYHRGRLTKKNVIDLPEYWRGLVDPESITVTLTQIRTSQDLIIDGIEWGSQIKIKSGNGTDIDCYYFCLLYTSDAADE